MKLHALAFVGLMVCTTVTWADASSPRKLLEMPTQRIVAILGSGCDFAVSLPGKKGVKSPVDSSETGINVDATSQSGVIVASPQPAHWRSTMTALELGVVCENKSDPDAMETGVNYLGAKYDKLKKVWIKDLDSWFAFAEFTKNERRVLDNATRVVNIQSVNSKGYAKLTDDTTGDERHRTKTIDFCMFHPPRALCGNGTVANLADGPKGDLSKYALEILKSIEFLDDVHVLKPALTK